MDRAVSESVAAERSVADGLAADGSWQERLAAAVEADDFLAGRRVLGDVARVRSQRDAALDQLAVAAAGGSEVALALLVGVVDEHGVARAAVRRALITESDVDDVAQEALVSVVRSISTFSLEKASFVTWLFEIAKNRSIDFLRRQRTTLELHDDEVGEILRISSLITSREHVQALVKRLPEPYRTAVTLRDLEQFTYREISGQLGLNENTVKSHVKRGRDKMVLMAKRAG